MKKLRQKIGAMRINRKIELAMALLLVVTSAFILLVFSMMSQRILKNKSLELATQQIDTASYNTGQLLNAVHNISAEIVGNSWVQSYLRAVQGAAANYTQLERSANEVLDNQRDSNSILRFVALEKHSNGQLLYTGTTWTLPYFTREINQVYEESRPLGLANMSYALRPDLFDPAQYSFHFFMPIYNLFSLDEQLGMLYLCVPESEVRAVYRGSADDTLTTYLADGEGRVLSAAQAELLGEAGGLGVAGLGAQGNLEQDGGDTLVIYQRLPGTGWYMVGEIPAATLLDDFVYLVTLSAVVLVLSLAVAVALAHWITRTIYRPVEAVIDTMDKVAGGDLQVQIPEENSGADLRRLTTSFNTMVRQINGLMEQVKEEQRLVDKAKFNMLQSQIQPHFLYNVLDSIHWQAAYNQDKEVSDMVQILANYYRLSLSRGSDIIPLRQELDMVRHYLTLQNLRYDNLVDFEAEVPERFAELPIPKLTLQPLVENAIYHGFRSESIQRGHIHLRAHTEGGDVLLEMEDDGSGGSEAQVAALNASLREYDEKAGYGLQNVQKRFNIYFGQGYGLHIDKNEKGGLTVTVRLPGPDTNGARSQFREES